MTGLRRLLRFLPVVVVAAGVVALIGPTARAEVAVALQQDTSYDEIASPYVLRIIVDDPDPSVWVRYNDDGDSRKVLNEDGFANGDGEPSLLYVPGSKTAIVVWARNSPAGFDVVYSRFSGGVWATPVELAASPADELDPYLMLDPADGSIHVVYWIEDGADSRVMHRQAPADLSSWSDPLRISQPCEAAARPSAALHAGQLAIAYESHGTALGSIPRQIVLAWKSGAVITRETVATTVHAAPNRPEIHSRYDKLWVDWVDDTQQMTWRRRTAPGPWEPIEIESFTNPEERDFHVRGQIRHQAIQ